jgi:peptidoglycan/xylan/chitin deacetylase (PgdA/CDA1 family)
VGLHLAVLLCLINSPPVSKNPLRHEPTKLPHHEVRVRAVKRSGQVQAPVRLHRLYLTFDDHPNPKTNNLLRILRSCKIRSTFFVVSYPEMYYQKGGMYQTPNTTKLHNSLVRIKNDGHILGNHSVSHRNLCRLPIWKIRWELSTTQKLIKAATGIQMKFWRPPHMTRCRKAVRVSRQLGLRTVLAHVDDWKRPSSRMWKMVRYRARRRSYSIILFHNNLRRIENFLKLSGLCRR